MKLIATKGSKTIHAHSQTVNKHLIAECGWYQRETLYKTASDSYLLDGIPNCKKCLKLLNKSESKE